MSNLNLPAGCDQPIDAVSFVTRYSTGRQRARLGATCLSIMQDICLRGGVMRLYIVGPLISSIDVPYEFHVSVVRPFTSHEQAVEEDLLCGQHLRRLSFSEDFSLVEDRLKLTRSTLNDGHIAAVRVRNTTCRCVAHSYFIDTPETIAPEHRWLLITPGTDLGAYGINTKNMTEPHILVLLRGEPYVRPLVVNISVEFGQMRLAVMYVRTTNSLPLLRYYYIFEIPDELRGGNISVEVDASRRLLENLGPIQ
jgi:hypothetical protein